MEPQFPIVQIEIYKWDLDLMAELYRFDNFYYSTDHAFYNSYLYNKRFLDSNGQIFLAKEKIKVNDFFSKIGIKKKYKIIFEPTGEHWSFDQVKRYLISKINELPYDEGRDAWITSLQRANTIKELIEAER